MNKMTRVAGTALALLTLATPAALAQTAPKNATVAVTAIVEHPALDATRDGVRDELAAQGWKVGENLRFDYQSAQGNPGTAVQIARQFVGQGPDVIVPISTPSAQAVVVGGPRYPGRVHRRHRSAGRPARTRYGEARPQRHRPVRPVADRRPSGADPGGPARGQASRRAVQSGRAQFRHPDRDHQEAGARTGIHRRRGACHQVGRRPGRRARAGRPGGRDLCADRQHDRLRPGGPADRRRRRTSCRSSAAIPTASSAARSRPSASTIIRSDARPARSSPACSRARSRATSPCARRRAPTCTSTRRRPQAMGVTIPEAVVARASKVIGQ